MLLKLRAKTGPGCNKSMQMLINNSVQPKNIIHEITERAIPTIFLHILSDITLLVILLLSSLALKCKLESSSMLLNPRTINSDKYF